MKMLRTKNDRRFFRQACYQRKYSPSNISPQKPIHDTLEI